jgi:uncharacterized protein (UPF0248 family)
MDQFDEYELKEDNEYDDEYDEEDGADKWSDDERGNRRDEERGDETQLQAGFSDVGRTSIADDCGGTSVIISGKLSDLNKDINKLTHDPLERFKIYVGAISHSMTENGVYDISVDDRNYMCRVASSLNNAKNLNPTAYILGFIATNGGRVSSNGKREINKKKITQIFSFLGVLNDDSVKPPDVIRYSRVLFKFDFEL